MISYVCLDCDQTFTEPAITYEDYECRGSFVSRRYECCPFCFGWAFEEC